MAAIVGLTVILAVLGLVGVQIYLLCTRGQTIGKKVLGIRIVNYPQGSRPDFVHVWLLRSFVVGIITAIPLLGPIFFIVDSCFILRENRRCLHDEIAGTTVIVA